MAKTSRPIKAKRPQVKPGELVVLSPIKRPIPAYDGKPFVGRETVLTVSGVSGTGTVRSPWQVVVTDGQHSWHLEGDDVVLADPDVASMRSAARLEREIKAAVASGPLFRTRAAFMLPGHRNWTWKTWSHRHPSKHAAIIEMAKELGATGWDFGQGDHGMAGEVNF